MGKDIAAATHRFTKELHHRNPHVDVEIMPELMYSEDVHLRVIVSRPQDADDVTDSISELTTTIYLDTGVYILAYKRYIGPVPVDAD